MGVGMVDEATLNRARANVVVSIEVWRKLIGERLGDVGRCLHHAGSNNSWFAISWIAPELDFAVLCTTNMGGEGVFPKADAVNWAVIEDHLRQK